MIIPAILFGVIIRGVIVQQPLITPLPQLC